MTTERLRLELSTKPDWDRLERLRSLVGFALRALHDEPPLLDGLAMVASELLENAVKYGAPGAEVLTLGLTDSGETLTVFVRNKLEPGSPHGAALRERIAWVASFPDAASAYEAALASLFEAHPESDERNGLGLARIAYEGRCTLECDFDAEGRVTVRARHKVQREGER